MYQSLFTYSKSIGKSIISERIKLPIGNKVDLSLIPEVLVEVFRFFQ